MVGSNICECPFCKDRIDFDIDPFLMEEVSSENVVLFIGSGVSTEYPHAAPHSLYIELAKELGLSECNLSFPDLAEKYVKQPDGRFKLLRRIQDRLDYMKKFSDTRYESTKFHSEESTMPYFKIFVTTNWDRSIEDICHAKPFVYDADLRFWEIPFRKVLKIHGTIDDYSSIIATRQDYNECAERMQKSLIGAKLKEILTTKTCIFIGYSLNDDDFKEIFDFVREAQGKFEKVHYLVSPNINFENLYNNIRGIKTDGTYFLQIVKEHMCSKYCYLSDDIFEAANDELYELLKEHEYLTENFDGKKFPQVLPSMVYQDGLIHGLRLAIDKQGSGEFSDLHVLQAKARLYESKIKNYKSSRSYLEVAYFEGFCNILRALVINHIEDDNYYAWPPYYYYERKGEMDRDEFIRSLETLPEVHKATFNECKRIVRKWPEDEKFVLQHTPWG